MIAGVGGNKDYNIFVSLDTFSESNVPVVSPMRARG